MADKSFGVKELNLLNASGTPTVTSPNNLNLNANTVAISTSCTIGSNLTVSGDIDVDGHTNLDNVSVAGVTTASGGIYLRADVLSGSSTNRIYIGAGDDLTLFHDSSNSYLQNHTGDLIIGETNHIYVKGYTSDKSAGLWFNNSEKIRTTNTGAVVTGILTATTFSGDPSNDSPHSLWDVVNNSASSYRFTGPGQDGAEDNPDIYLVRGQRYVFKMNASGHPFQIRVSNGGSAYSDGVTNNGAQTGNVVFNVQHDAPAHLFYQCTSHGSMVGNIYIVGQHLANGADNRVLTATSAYGMNGEAGLTFNGGLLHIKDDTSPAIRLQDNNNVNSDFKIYSPDGVNHLRIYHENTSSDLVTIASGGSVGIGTVVPATNLHVEGTGTDILKITSRAAGAQGTNLLMQHSSSSPADDDVISLIQFNGLDDSFNNTTYSSIRAVATDVSNNSESGAITFHTRNAGTFDERVRITSGGNVEITDGNLIVANGHGIDFSATANSSGSMSTELLDDYEEGSWTPAAKNAGSFTSPTGRYVKIGHQVTVWGYIPTATDITSTSNFEISGLPYSARNSGHTEFVGPCMLRYINSTSATGVSFSTYQSSGWNYLRIYASRDDGNNYEAVKHSDFAFTSTGIRFCHSYTV